MAAHWNSPRHEASPRQAFLSETPEERVDALRSLRVRVYAPAFARNLRHYVSESMHEVHARGTLVKRRGRKGK